MTTVYGRVIVAGLERQKTLARRNCQACGEEMHMAAYLGGDGLTDEQLATHDVWDLIAHDDCASDADEG